MNLIGNKLIIVCGGVGLFLLFYLLICEPNVKNIKVMSNDIKAKTKELKKETSLREKLKSMEDKKLKLQKELREFKQALPNQEGLKSLIKDVWETARYNGVMIKSLQPGQVIKGDLYSWLTLRLNLEGDFKRIYNFIYRIESLSRLIRVGKMRLTVLKNESPSANQGIPLEADLELQAFISAESVSNSSPAEVTEVIDPLFDVVVSGTEKEVHDPFKGSEPLKGDTGFLSQPVEKRFYLQGLMLNGALPLAIIDGEIYGIGEKVGTGLLKEINEEGVIIKEGGREFTLLLEEKRE